MNTRSNLQEHLSWLISSNAHLPTVPLAPAVITGRPQLVAEDSFGSRLLNNPAVSLPFSAPAPPPPPPAPVALPEPANSTSTFDNRFRTVPSAGSVGLSKQFSQQGGLPQLSGSSFGPNAGAFSSHSGQSGFTTIPNTLPSAEPLKAEGFSSSSVISRPRTGDSGGGEGVTLMVEPSTASTSTSRSHPSFGNSGSDGPGHSTSSLPSSSNDEKRKDAPLSRTVTSRAASSSHFPSSGRTPRTPQHAVVAIDLSGDQPVPLASTAFDYDPVLSGSARNKRKSECPDNATPSSLPKRPRGDITDLELDSQPPTPYDPPPGGDILDLDNIDDYLDDEIVSSGLASQMPSSSGTGPSQHTGTQSNEVRVLATPREKVSTYQVSGPTEQSLLVYNGVSGSQNDSLRIRPGSPTEMIFDSEDEIDISIAVEEMQTMTSEVTVKGPLSTPESKLQSIQTSNVAGNFRPSRTLTSINRQFDNNDPLTEERIDRLLFQSEEERKSAAEKASAYIHQHSELSNELQGELFAAKKKVNSLETLKQLVVDIRCWIRQKGQLEAQIMTGVREGREKHLFFTLLDKNAEVHQNLKTATSQGQKLLNDVGLPLGSLDYLHKTGVVRVSNYADEVVVKSTQETVSNLRLQPARSNQSHSHHQPDELSDGSQTPFLIASSPRMMQSFPQLEHQSSITELGNSFPIPAPSNRNPDFGRPPPTFNLDARDREHIYDASSSNFPLAPQQSDRPATYPNPPPLDPAVLPGPSGSLQRRPDGSVQANVRSTNANNGAGVEEYDASNESDRYALQMGAPTITHPQYAHMGFPWSQEVSTMLKTKFKMSGFRPNQLEAINTTLSGRDAFVLMPTGGGKSLCYQLPAIVRGGKTSGVTMVVSPLLSLMDDQVMHLRERDIKAYFFSSEASADEKQNIYQFLDSADPHIHIQLLYITPEMLTKNIKIIESLKSLHQRGQLARIVIDEAHCVSQWGHDFRPDYKAIGGMRAEFPGVPLMALTATATPEVEGDVKHNLGMSNCETFRQTFNRPNLRYEVRKKPSGNALVQSIASFIKENHAGQSGIIYCYTRNDCEKVALALKKDYRISAQHYHATMETEDKRQAQMSWQRGWTKVIVATIAFGMGIDKPDVRFVIHHTIPKSLEGYYQETGRAGRDGKASNCLLFYAYSDFNALKRMMESTNKENCEAAHSWEDKKLLEAQLARQIRMLRSVIQFCDNLRDCRRVQVLEYFGETFLPELCRKTCDNCRSDAVYEGIDVLDHARNILSLLNRIQRENVGLVHCIDVYRGSRAKTVMTRSHHTVPEYGLGKDLDRDVVERLFRKLFREGFIKEVNVINKGGFPNQFVVLAQNAQPTIARLNSFMLDVETKASKRSKGKKTADGQQDGLPASTNVPSPVRRRTRKKKGDDDGVVAGPSNQNSRSTRNRFIVGNEDEDEDDGFEPIRRVNDPRARVNANGNATAAGPLGLSEPISTDEKMSRLNDAHRDVVENFVSAAQSISRQLIVERDLRAAPFPDLILREMAISFPRNLEEMAAIPGIDRMKVETFGARFLPLIAQHRSFYEDAMMNDGNGDGDGYDDDDIIPYDPNHQNVITLEDSDDEAARLAGRGGSVGNESDYGTWSEFEDDLILESMNDHLFADGSTGGVGHGGGGVGFAGNTSGTRSSYFNNSGPSLAPPQIPAQPFRPLGGDAGGSGPPARTPRRQTSSSSSRNRRGGTAGSAGSGHFGNSRYGRRSGTGGSSSRGGGSRSGGGGRARTGSGAAARAGASDLAGVQKGMMNKFAYSEQGGGGAGSRASRTGSRNARGGGGGGGGCIGAMPT